MGIVSRCVRWFGRLGRRFVFLKDTHNFAEKSFFLFVGVRTRLLLVGGLGAVGRRRQGLIPKTHQVRKESADAARLVAGFVRFGTGHEGSRVCFWTGRSCEPVGGLVELYIDHAGRLAEPAHIGILGQRAGLFHEFGPDRCGRLGTAQVQVAVVVVANPHNAEQVACVTGEPAVMRAAGLPGGGLFEAAPADGGVAQAEVHDPLHHVGHDEGNAGIEHLALLGREVLHHVAL